MKSKSLLLIPFALAITLSANDDSYEIPKYLHPGTNLESMKLSHIDELWKAPYNLSGEGVKVAVVDWGQIRVTHQEFQRNGKSRVIIKGKENQKRPPHEHSTFLAGIIAAKGVKPEAKGAAENVLLYSYYAPEFSYSRAVLKAYEDEGITISNHAYLYTDVQYDGVYDNEAHFMDKAVYEHPYLNVFMAGGNDRGHDNEGNYKQLKGPRTCKNVFTIAVTMNNGEEIAPYSNRGPVNDGRIKPDFAVASPGNSYVLSTGEKSDDAYIIRGGTTSATARTVGATALLLEWYKKLTGNDKIRHDLLKALYINTASDRGRKGPDYIYGFGVIDPKKAADVLWTIISKKSLIKEDEIDTKTVKEYKISLKYPSTIKLTMVWIDPPGPAENPQIPDTQKPTLINDLDIWIEKDGKKYYPFSLDGEHPEKEATADTFNRVDNVEQIVIENAEAGEYRVYVKAYKLNTKKQKYTIVSNIYMEDSSFSENTLNEKEKFITRYYKEILDREGSQEEIKFWEKELDSQNMSALDLAEFFFNSEEFKAQNIDDKEFVEKVYKVMLNREADEEGENYWLQRLKEGSTSRSLIIYEFGFSKEFSDLCKKSKIEPFNTDNYLEAFIKRLYILVLKREYDPKGLNDWKKALKNGEQTASSIVKNFFFSEEFKKQNLNAEELIKVVYLTILGREASEEEIEFWSEKLNNKEISKEELLNNFLNSKEFEELAKKYRIEIK